MAVTITITSPTGSELPLHDWFANADVVTPLNMAAGEYSLSTTGTFLGGAVELRFKSSGNDLTYDGFNAPDAGTLDSLEVWSVSLGMVVATITGFSQPAAQLYYDIGFGAAAPAAFILTDSIAYTGDIGDDHFVGGSGVNNIVGGKGNDTLAAGYLNDKIFGGEGDDTLRGGNGLNDLIGGDGFDTADYSEAGSGIIFNQASNAVVTADFSIGDNVETIEKIVGSNFADKFVGDGSDTQFVGGAGKDEILGGAGDDWATGGADADVIDGGEGADLLLYDKSAAGVTVTLGAANVETIATGGDAAGDKVKNFENIIGSDYKDVLTGNALNNRLLGFLGDDTLKGTGGDDKLTGGIGKDTFDGGTENDILDGGADADSITGGTGIDVATYKDSASAVTINLVTNINTGGDAQGDKLFTVENIIGSAQDDSITGGTGDNIIEGGAGADTITGTLNDTASYLNSSAGVQIDLSLGGVAQASTGDGSGDKLIGILNLRGSTNADKFTGNASDNVIEGGGGADELDGGAGIDTVSYASSGGAVDVTLGTSGMTTSGSGADASGDTIKNFENIIGSAFDDSLTGNDIANKLTSGKGHDNFQGWAGADIIEGGDGNDTASYENSDVGVTVNLTLNINTGGHAQGDKLTGVENIFASEFKDKLTGDALANQLYGSTDDDIIDGAGGNDFLSGGSGNDTIQGGIGDDFIGGDTGADVMDGGANIDTLSYAGSGAVKVKLGEGLAAQIQSAATKVTVNGVADIELGGNDAEGDSVKNFENLNGSDLDDVLVGNSGANRIEGRGGKDNIDGGNGIDNIFGGFGNDTIFGGEGDDVIEGGAGADKMDGGLGKNTLSYAADTAGVDIDLSFATAADGDAAGDTITNFRNVRGGSGGDFIVGDTNANILEGGGEQDTLIGGGGADTLDGGDTLFDIVSYFGTNASLTVTLGTNGAAATVIAAAGTDPAGDIVKNIENVLGGGGNDKITGNEFDNNLSGSDGDDVLEGLTGFNSFFGGMGIDTATYAKSNASVFVTINGATSSGGVGGHATGDGLVQIENLIGSNFNDTLTAIAAAEVNSLKGGGGNDIVEGGQAGDMLFGELGLDTLSYFKDTAGVVVTLKGALAADVSGSVNAGNHAAGDTATGFENLLGGSGSDILTGDAAVNVIDGGGMFDNDKLDGAGGLDTVSYATAVNKVTVTLGLNGAETTGNGISGDNDSIKNFENITGGDLDDILTGNNLANVLTGGAGHDTLIGGGGADKLDGGAGFADIADYSMLTAAQSIIVKLNANGSASTVTSSAGSPAAGDTLTNIEKVKGGAGNDKLSGFGAGKFLYGNDGDDVLEAVGIGPDILDGGNGIDTVTYANAAGGVNVQLQFANQGGAGDAAGDNLSGIENLIGSAFNDSLRGFTGVNVINGGAGDDFVGGGDGADILDGGTNNAVDYVQNKRGDIVDYNEITDIDLVITLGNAGAKTIVTATGVNASFANGDEISNFESIYAANGKDILTGNSGGNAIYGLGGNDLIDGGAGSDYMDGGADVDTLSYASATAGITINLGLNSVQNTVGSGIDQILQFENLIGSSKNDKLTGGGIANKIEGGDGDDIIEGRQGSDTLSGGNGNDTVSYENSSTLVIVNLNLQDGVAKQFGGEAEEDILTGFENLTGSALNDILTGDANVNIIKGLAENDTINGGAAADTLDGGAGASDTLSYLGDVNGVTVTLGVNGAQTIATGLSHGTGDKVSNFENIQGGTGNDKLIGNALVNTILGGSGDDLIEGGAGDDILDGEGGTNTLSFAGATSAITVNLFNAGLNLNTGAGFDTFTNFENLTGSAKNDTLTGDNSSNVIDGGAGDDIINGLNGSDTIVGGAGNDTIDGGVNNDTIDGGIGNDILNGGNNNDTIDGGAGNDIINGGDQTDTATYASATAAVTVNLSVAAAQNTVGAGIDTLSNIERLTGSKFNDILTGDGNANIVVGGDGNDKIDGGASGDTLTGGIGSDTFIYNSGVANGDDITDFTGGADKIQISKSGFGIPATVALNGVGANNFGFEYFVSGSAAVADKAHGQFVFDTDTFQLSWDADGTGGGAAELIADFTNNYNLLATDFTLV